MLDRRRIDRVLRLQFCSLGDTLIKSSRRPGTIHGSKQIR